MARPLDPRNPAFKFLGEKECRSTLCFIAPDGHLFWVPYAAMKSYFLRELPMHDFSDWHKRLVLKEIK